MFGAQNSLVFPVRASIARSSLDCPFEWSHAGSCGDVPRASVREVSLGPLERDDELGAVGAVSEGHLAAVTVERCIDQVRAETGAGTLQPFLTPAVDLVFRWSGMPGLLSAMWTDTTSEVVPTATRRRGTELS